MKEFILNWVWQAPQNILGATYKLLLTNRKKIKTSSIYVKKFNAEVYHHKFTGGISLGKYIFVYNNKNKGLIIRHECGHVKQSKILGPLYLLVIGIPSIIHAAISSGKNNYFNFYTERWANKIVKFRS